MPGDWLVVFSDGVSEAMSARRRGIRRRAHPRRRRQAGDAAPADLLQAIFAAVRAFTNGAPQSDDITAMVLRYGDR